MALTGFSSPFYIRRKRNLYAIQFLMYLDGRQSAGATWPDTEDTAVDPTVSGAALAPYGYIFDGVNDYLTGNLGVNGVTITQFTIAAVIIRNESSNNEAVIQTAFGNNLRPRIYFTGTTLVAEVQIDSTTRTVTVANSDTYITPGHPALIVLRGNVATGIEVLIDGVSVGTDTHTGSAFGATGSGNFNIGKDTGLSYFQNGSTRLLAICATKLTDAQLSAWRNQLEYEGFFDVWRDDFAKWTGSDSIDFSAATQIDVSPYVATRIDEE